jgi:hypothetical protein
MLDPIVCRACRKDAWGGGSVGPQCDVDLSDRGGWECPSQGFGEHPVYRDEAPIKGCRRLFEQSVAATVNVDKTKDINNGV